MQAFKLQALLKNPNLKSLLFYGEETFFQRAYLKELVQLKEAKLNCIPFSDFEKKKNSLLDLLKTRSLWGDQEIVVLEDVPERFLNTLEKVLTSLDTQEFFVVTAGDLNFKSKLRVFYESQKDLAAFACLPLRGKDLRDYLKNALNALPLETLDFLEEYFTMHPTFLEKEVEKLSLLSSLNMETLQKALFSFELSNLEESVRCILTKGEGETAKAIALCFQEGVSPITLVRALLANLMLLGKVMAALRVQPSLESVLANITPPLYSKRRLEMKEALQKWSPAGLKRAIRALYKAELFSKTHYELSSSYCLDLFLKIVQGRA